MNIRLVDLTDKPKTLSFGVGMCGFYVSCMIHKIYIYYGTHIQPFGGVGMASNTIDYCQM